VHVARVIGERLGHSRIEWSHQRFGIYWKKSSFLLAKIAAFLIHEGDCVGFHGIMA
jgi:hypothetical protein